MFSHFEGIQSSLSGVLRSTEKGKKMFEDLRKFSFDTTFGVDTLADASQQLLNVGMHVDELKPSLMMLGNIAQGDTAKFQELVGIYGKILNTGKAGSMQLQQLALRGVPIQQMLKEMGKSGTASAKDITEAFEKMTSAGGQFEGAMERINETIAGREGFISDTWREFLVSFAEASGIGDLYKEALNPIYDMLQGIVDWLQKVNEDPFMKKVFQGVLVGIIGAVVGAIVTGLIPALIKVVALVTTASGGMNLLIGALAGLGVGIAGFAGFKLLASQSNESYEALKKQREELEKVDAIINGSNESKFEKLNDIIHSFNFAIAKTLKDLEDLKNSNEGYGYYDESTNTYVDNYKDTERYRILVSQLENLKNQQILTERLRDANERNLGYEKRRLEIIKQANKDYNKLLEDYNATDYGKKQNQLKAIREDIKHYENMLKTGRKTEAYTETLASGDTVARERLVDLTSDDRNMIKRILEELYADILKASNVDTWQKHFKKVTGTDVEGLDGNKAVAKYLKEYAVNLEKLKEDEKKKDPYGQYLKALNDSHATRNQLNYGNKMDEYTQNQEILDAYREARKQLLAEKYAKGGDVFTKNDNSIKRLDEAIKNQEMALEENTKNLIVLGDKKKWDDILQSGLSGLAGYLSEESKNSYASGNVAGGAVNQLGYSVVGSIQGTKTGAIAQGAMQGSVAGPWGALIGAIVGLVSKLEGFTKLIGRLDPLLDPLCDFLNEILEGLGIMVDGIQIIIDAISPLLKVITNFSKIFNALGMVVNKIGKSITRVLSPVLRLFERLADALGNFADKILSFFGISSDDDSAKQEERDILERLNEQLERMTSTIKDQISYYYEMKRAMDSAFINEQIESGIMNGKVTRMNDGIITPKGLFSTAPDDYIMAMKHPEDLVRGGSVVNMNVVIKNTVSDVVQADVQQTTDENGEQQLFVTISKKIAGDVAMGANGWDSALDYRTNRLRGRRIG